MNSLEQHIITLQQQIDQLAAQVSTLRNLALSEQSNLDKPLVDKPAQQSKNPLSSVGINRFRQLQEM